MNHFRVEKVGKKESETQKLINETEKPAVILDCKHHLSEPDLKLVWPSAKLLQAACSGSSRASHLVTAAVMPSLVEQYNNRTQVHKDVCLAECELSLEANQNSGG